VESFPPLDLFEEFEKFGAPGHKFILSERRNTKTYTDFVRGHPVWSEFHRWIKSDEFIYGVLETLREHHVDLGFPRMRTRTRWRRTMKAIWHLRPSSAPPRLSARFDFSALPADGGHLAPHTDAESKIVTLVVSMVRAGEWNPAFGGGTDVNRPKSERHAYNQGNLGASFEDMDVVETFAFVPNQAVIFVKTYNSWHSVRPMTGVGSKDVRRTLTINIETRAR
jgi:hypothetical protein